MSRHFSDWDAANDVISRLIDEAFGISIESMSFNEFFVGFLNLDKVLDLIPENQLSKFITVYNDFIGLTDKMLGLSQILSDLNGFDDDRLESIKDSLVSSIAERITWFESIHGFTIKDAIRQFFDVPPMVGRIQIDQRFPGIKPDVDDGCLTGSSVGGF